MTDRGDEAGQADVDPAVWRQVVDAAGDDRSVVLLSRDFSAAAAVTADPSSKNVLEVLALATSAMLKPDNWNEPFTPYMTLQDGRRSALPTDLDDAQRALLLRIAAALDDTDDPALRARVYDICWTYIDRSGASMLVAAIDAYTSVPLEPDVWHGDGREEWQRAFELVRRRSTSGREQVEAMSIAVRDRIRRTTRAEGFFGVQLSEFARAYKVVDKNGSSDFAELAVSHAQQARKDSAWRLAQAWEQEAAVWYSASGNSESAASAMLRLAGDLASEAVDRRQGVGGDAATAGHFTEQAITVLQKLPRAFRTANAVDELVVDLRRQLKEDRETLLGSMVPISGGSIELSEQAAAARRSVSGKDPVTALIALASLAPLADPSHAEATARDDMERHPLSFLFAGETYRGSGQKVAARPGMSLGADASASAGLDPAVWATMVRNHLLLAEIRVSGFILPALQVVTVEHRYGAELLYSICYKSPATPQGHENVWALGLQHGLDNDFASAASLLVPQIEHWVRARLKERGVHTLVTDERGVETEKGLGTLLEDPQSSDAIGPQLVFELKSLLTDQAGPNLRNDIAHGLVDDQALSSSAAVYCWWLALKLVMVPLAAAISAQQHVADGEDTGSGDQPESEPH